MDAERHNQILREGAERFGCSKREYMETLDYMLTVITVNKGEKVNA